MRKTRAWWSTPQDCIRRTVMPPSQSRSTPNTWLHGLAAWARQAKARGPALTKLSTGVALLLQQPGTPTRPCSSLGRQVQGEGRTLAHPTLP